MISSTAELTQYVYRFANINLLVGDTTKDVEILNDASRIKLSSTRHFNNKEIISAPYGYHKTDAHAREFVEQDWTTYDLAMHVINGGAFSVAQYRNQHRSTENFISSQLIVIDIDKGNHSIKILSEDEFIRAHAFLIHPTTNSKPEAPRSHIFFRLDKQITDPIVYKDMVKKLIEWFAIYDVDTGCDDACQLFFGTSTEKFIFSPENVLPIATVDSLGVRFKENEELTKKNSKDNAVYSNEHFDSYVDAIKGQLFKLQPKLAEGKHVTCPNPDHPDTHPSFRISYDRDKLLGIPICTCGNLNWKQVGDWIGLRYEDWLKQNPRKNGLGAVQLSDNSLDNALREYFLQEKLDSVARLLDAALMLGMKPGQQFSESDMVHLLANIAVSRKTVTAMLKVELSITNNDETPKYSLFQLDKPEQSKTSDKDLVNSSIDLSEIATEVNYVPDCNDNCEAVMQQGTAARVTNANGDIIPASNIKKKPGRPAKSIYTFPDQKIVMESLGISPMGVTDKLSLNDVMTNKNYRSTLSHKLIERREGVYNNNWRSRRLGIDNSTLWRYDRDKGIVKTARIDLTLVTSANAYNLLIPTDEKYKASNYEYLIDKYGDWFRPELEYGLTLIDQKRDPVLVQHRASHCAVVGGHGDAVITSANGKPRQIDVKYRKTALKQNLPKHLYNKQREIRSVGPRIIFPDGMSENQVLSLLYTNYFDSV